ncbi:MAG: DUF5685 family protein [Firmicutes bacterium]|nr:DUF5685 family protein [Bacillota bacterium]
MYGYVTPLKNELHCSDFMLFRSFYCGICKATGKAFGQIPRFTTNYDITFLSVLLHEFTGAEYAFEKKACVLNPFKKKVYVSPNGLGEKIAAANVILSYYKAADGCVDREGAKMRFARAILKKPYKKAVALLPGVDNACKTWYDNLRALEKENCQSPDRAADCFANMLAEVTLYIVGTTKCKERLTEHEGECPVVSGQWSVVSDQCQEDKKMTGATSPLSFVSDCGIANEKQNRTLITDHWPLATELKALSYNVGKFVYLADALDDVGEDHKKNRYNPFLAAYGGFTTRAGFIQKNREALTFILASGVNRAIESFNNMRHIFKGGGGLVQNILYKGLRAKCEELLGSEKKLKPPRL